jgi:hypothetical protein
MLLFEGVQRVKELESVSGAETGVTLPSAGRGAEAKSKVGTGKGAVHLKLSKPVSPASFRDHRLRRIL